MPTKIRLYENRSYLWWWKAHRAVCWFIGHEEHELAHSEGYWNTHYCPRCLKFWRRVREKL